jgi:hypothetical protein
MSQAQLSEASRKALMSAIEAHSVNPVARALGLGREAVARLAAGIPVRAGTVALAERNLPRLDVLTSQASQALGLESEAEPLSAVR